MGVSRCICFRPWNDADQEADADTRQISQEQIMARKGEAGMVRTRQATAKTVVLAQRRPSCRRLGRLPPSYIQLSGERCLLFVPRVSI